MPEIARFRGIVIAMYYRDHSPPHFHAVCGEFDATIEIAAARFRDAFAAHRAFGVIQYYCTLSKPSMSAATGSGFDSTMGPKAKSISQTI